MTNLLLLWLWYMIIGIVVVWLWAIIMSACSALLLDHDHWRMFMIWLDDYEHELWDNKSQIQIIGNVVLVTLFAWPQRIASGSVLVVRKMKELYRDQTTIKES